MFGCSPRRWLTWPQLVEPNCWPADCHPLTLRLVAPSLEAAFIHSREGALTTRLFTSAALVLTYCLELLLDGSQRQPHGTGEVVQGDSGRFATTQRTVVGTTAASSLLLMLILKNRPRIFGLGAASCEVGAICAAIGLTIAILYAAVYSDTRRYGLDPGVWCRYAMPHGSGDLAEQPYAGDSRLLLSLAFVDLSMYLLLPVRLCIVWVVGLAGIAGYSLIILIVAPEGLQSAAENVLLLTAVNVVGLLGKWRLECHERMVFLGGHCKFSEEESFSFEMEAPLLEFSEGEFDEDLANDDDEDAPQEGECADDARSSVPSVPTTTQTGRVFAELERADVEPRWKLERIAAIGLKEHWLIDATDVRILPNRVLGSGSFGVVVLANLHGSQVAVKVPRSSNGASAWHLPSIGNELRVLRHVRHPNVVLFHGACIDPKSSELALVLEYVDGQVLDKYLQAGPSDTNRHCICLDVCCALRYLHGQKPSVVHGDLKTSNILVEDRRARAHCKLVDFGLSRLLTRKAKPLGGTLTWMAPELLIKPGMPPAPSADVFSFGRLMYHVITGGNALSGVDARALVKMARASKLPQLVWSDSAPFLSECKALVTECTQFEARPRPPMVAVYNDLVTWQLRGDASDTSGTSDTLEGQGEAWSDGLRILRELLRPVPKNRTHALGSELVRECSSDSPQGTPTGGAVSPESGVGESTPRTADGVRRERPLPPPRSPGENLRIRKRELPSLPPVEEVAINGPFSSFAKSMSAPGNLSQFTFMADTPSALDGFDGCMPELGAFRGSSSPSIPGQSPPSVCEVGFGFGGSGQWPTSSPTNVEHEADTLNLQTM